MNVILMGPQGSGKSTQAELLAKKSGIPHIETGEIYRAIAQENTPLGNKIKAVLASGDLIDDATTLEVVDKHLAQITDGFVLDGFPRTLVQAQRDLVSVDKVVYLKLSDEEATKRLLLRKRQDDTPEIIAERLRLYHEMTEPILEYYRQQGKLVEIDGSGTIEEVFKKITEVI